MQASNEENQVKEEDPLVTLTRLSYEALVPNWTKEEYNRILLCKLGDLKKFKRCEMIKFENNMVFETTNPKGGKPEDEFRVPVVHVAFCGSILQSKMIDGMRWFEIGDSNETIQCQADPVDVQQIEEERNQFRASRQIYFDKEAELKEIEENEPTNTAGIQQKQRELNQAYLLHMLDKRTNDISYKLRAAHFDTSEKVDYRRVMIVGKLWEKNSVRYVTVKQCRFIEDDEEKRLVEMINLAK